MEGRSTECMYYLFAVVFNTVIYLEVNGRTGEERVRVTSKRGWKAMGFGAKSE